MKLLSESGQQSVSMGKYICINSEKFSTKSNWGAYLSFGNRDKTMFLTVKKWSFQKFWV